MLGKCTNPSCSAPFRYLQNGQLSRLEADPVLRTSKFNKPEYFWLCGQCSSSMTLRIGGEGKVTPIVLPAPTNADRDGNGIALVDRREGLLLSRLGFLRKAHRTGAVFFG
jgi:hypothetical protein